MRSKNEDTDYIVTADPSASRKKPAAMVEMMSRALELIFRGKSRVGQTIRRGKYYYTNGDEEVFHTVKQKVAGQRRMKRVKVPQKLRHAHLIDRSKYTGEKLREIRADGKHR